jgi:ubiquinone/menaquinone biosynthesis C-methylase UbiE
MYISKYIVALTERNHMTHGFSSSLSKPAQSWVTDRHWSDEFAHIYERQGEKVTAQASAAAFEAVGIDLKGARVLDIAAGTGALSVPAAEKGAAVLAVDIAPGMVRRLSEKLRPFARCEARLMDGEALLLPDASFDAAFSMFGVSLFTDWRKGLKEQARVLKPGGRGCVATWRRPPGGGPFLILVQAYQRVFPDRRPPSRSTGYTWLAEPARLSKEMQQAGFRDVKAREVEVRWEGPTADHYLDDLRGLLEHMGPYAALDAPDRSRVDDAMLSIVRQLAPAGNLVMSAPVTIAAGTRA